jgi:hypothetical protein
MQWTASHRRLWLDLNSFLGQAGGLILSQTELRTQLCDFRGCTLKLIPFGQKPELTCLERGNVLPQVTFGFGGGVA